MMAAAATARAAPRAVATRHGAPESDAAYQRRLALSLIDTVGYDGAVRYCRNNAWDGVLHSILRLRGEFEPALRA